VSERISFIWWRLNLLLCKFKHDYEIVYTRVCVGGEADGHYSGRMDCKRCLHSEYFAGRNK